MLTCKKCGCEDSYTGRSCPMCGEAYVINDTDIAKYFALLDEAKREKDYEGILEATHFLADIGDSAAQRDMGKFLEDGELLQKDLDLAMKYFKLAAYQNEPYSAYRYSRLVSRADESAAWFWLLFSAVLGCTEAYPEVAESMSDRGYEEDAHYFYYLSALCDDIDSIITLAKRYSEGIGVPRSLGCAKWYMDKLKLPPIYAIKLAYRLRHEIPAEPPVPTLKNYTGLLRSMKKEAQASGWRSAFMKLCEILTERGDTDSMIDIGTAEIESGRTKSGLAHLSRAAASGNVRAHLQFARLYTEGKHLGKNLPEALSHLLSAGELGSAEAYKLAAEICTDSDSTVRDCNRAIELYGLADMLGLHECKEQIVKIKKEREELYRLAAEASPEDAYYSYGLSADMGHAPAMVSFADCLEHGIGCKINRHGAYLIYKKAASLMNTDGIYHTARCMLLGIGTNRDFYGARELLSMLQREGDARAEKLLASSDAARQRKRGQAKYQRAMGLIHKHKFALAAESLRGALKYKHGKGIYTLACLYDFGIGVRCNRDRAYELYETAFRLRFRDPSAEYKQLVFRMLKKAE